MVWTTLELFDQAPTINNKHPDRLYWTMKGNFSDDLIIGLLTAGTLLLKDEYDRDLVFILVNNRGLKLTIGDVDDLDEINLNPIEDEYLTEDTLDDVYPKTKQYGLLIDRYGDRNHYDFITFNHADEFMQGFISMCLAFRVDFRNYILGPPFDRDGIEYDVVGYDIPPYFTEDEDEYEDDDEYEEYEEEED